MSMQIVNRVISLTNSASGTDGRTFLVDSEEFGTEKLEEAQLQSSLKEYFDNEYAPIGGGAPTEYATYADLPVSGSSGDVLLVTEAVSGQGGLPFQVTWDSTNSIWIPVGEVVIWSGNFSFLTTGSTETLATITILINLCRNGLRLKGHIDAPSGHSGTHEAQVTFGGNVLLEQEIFSATATHVYSEIFAKYSTNEGFNPNTTPSEGGGSLGWRPYPTTDDNSATITHVTTEASIPMTYNKLYLIAY